MTINGKTMGENVKRADIQDADVIRSYKTAAEQERRTSRCSRATCSIPRS